MTSAESDPWAARRLVTEPPKDPGRDYADRSPYARDRARVLHSAAFRRLAAKTQVHTPAGDGLIRTRLTHSLEVAQIARELGASLGCDPDVVDTAGLAHDLGHPPFGHNGEDALHDAAQACGGFEGNAQTFRILTRLEAKVVGPDGRSAGLNLTRASLDAVSKYPWPRQDGQRKFGVYDDDLPTFTWMRQPPDGADGPAEGRVCLEAQVMDWADDVAYSVHDVEDGIAKGLICLRRLLDDPQERAALCHDVAREYSREPVDVLAGHLDVLLADPAIIAVATRADARAETPAGSSATERDFEQSPAAMVALKRLTSLLIGRLTSAAVTATKQTFGAGPLRRYDADLVVPAAARAQCALLKGIALRYVMRDPASESRYRRERELLTELVAEVAARAPDSLDRYFAAGWRSAADDRQRLRVVVDQIASLTDLAAYEWHARLLRPGKTRRSA